MGWGTVIRQHSWESWNWLTAPTGLQTALYSAHLYLVQYLVPPFPQPFSVSAAQISLLLEASTGYGPLASSVVQAPESVTFCPFAFWLPKCWWHLSMAVVFLSHFSYCYGFRFFCKNPITVILVGALGETLEVHVCASSFHGQLKVIYPFFSFNKIIEVLQQQELCLVFLRYLLTVNTYRFAWNPTLVGLQGWHDQFWG